MIALDPRLGVELDDDHLDSALEALGDFADLKSPLPHRSLPRASPTLPAGAAGTLGLPAADVRTVRRAALVHDVGMIGVPSAVWDEPRAVDRSASGSGPGPTRT